jgi:hypothetical protein
MPLELECNYIPDDYVLYFLSKQQKSHNTELNMVSVLR